MNNTSFSIRISVRSIRKIMAGAESMLQMRVIADRIEENCKMILADVSRQEQIAGRLDRSLMDSYGESRRREVMDAAATIKCIFGEFVPPETKYVTKEDIDEIIAETR